MQAELNSKKRGRIPDLQVALPLHLEARVKALRGVTVGPTNVVTCLGRASVHNEVIIAKRENTWKFTDFFQSC